MAIKEIEKYLPKTAAYINQVFEKEGLERGGHHNFVAERHMVNSYPAFCYLSKKALDIHDERLLARLKQLDNSQETLKKWNF